MQSLAHIKKTFRIQRFFNVGFKLTYSKHLSLTRAGFDYADLSTIYMQDQERQAGSD